MARQVKDEPIDLEHYVKLNGAKKPYNAFTISISGNVCGGTTTAYVKQSPFGYLWRPHSGIILYNNNIG